MIKTMNRPNSKFPASVYRDNVLTHIYADAKRLFLPSMLEIDRAHLIMLAEQKIIPRDVAVVCLQAIDTLDRDAILAHTYDGSVEDLFFYVEKQLAELCGRDNAGRIHTARSRNDLDMTMYRMVLRQQLLLVLEALLDLRAQLIGLAEAHRSDPMPAYTHNQPAQPTTLGHYLMAYIEVLERDAERLCAAYTRVNRNPLGACAITTTGFPIDRARTAELLGFRGLQTNSYGAIAAVDYLAEPCSTLAVAMLSLGRFTQDMLLFTTVEFNFLRLSEGYVQLSSIMPQKRNPVPLEHTRVLASRAMHEAHAVLSSLHNTPFADMNDSEDSLQPLVDLAFRDGLRALRLLAGILSEATFNTALMRSRADGDFLAVTELADTLVRETGISFQQAHAIVSQGVQAANGIFDRESMADAALTALPEPKPAREILLHALTAENFIAVRSVPGGPAPQALDPELGRARTQLTLDTSWLDAEKHHIVQAADTLQHTVKSYKS
jgi:argininosuccinate lyase